jgi:hypothetical protein
MSSLGMTLIFKLKILEFLENYQKKSTEIVIKIPFALQTTPLKF